MKNNFTIIGAGIGGLTTVLTLQQQGFGVTIFEGAPEIKPVGAGIILANNAMQVLRKLGLQEKLQQAGNRISAMNITDEQLKPLSVVDLKVYEQQYGVTNLAIHRGDLQKILAEEVGMQHIHLSKKLTKVDFSEKYALTFEDNTTATADLLIGADGIHSVVRKQLFSENQIRPAGQVCWRGVCEFDLPARYHHELNEAWGKGKRFGFVKINQNKVYWYALLNSQSATPENTDLLTTFREFNPIIGELLKATPASQTILSPISDLKPFANWHKNHVCLIGDAAHATTPNLGQGACQAIEDAYVLGKCFERGLNAPDAYQEYEQKRIKKAHMIVNTSRMVGKLAHVENNLGVWFRNNLMKRMPKSGNRKQMDMIFNLDS